MCLKFLFFKLPNFLNEGASSIRKKLFRGTINKRDEELQHVLKDLSIFEKILSKNFSTIDFYIIKKSIISHSNKSLQKSLYTQQKKSSSLTKLCSLPIFTANETITKLKQNKLSQEESGLFKAGLYFLNEPDKIRKSEICTTFENIHRYFINKLIPGKPKF